MGKAPWAKTPQTWSSYKRSEEAAIMETRAVEGENIWLRSSCAAPVQGVGGERGQEWLYDTFIRTRDGGQVGCHAMVLAASSPVLRGALEDAKNDSEETALILMPNNYLEDITNLLNLLYTGTCNQTEGLNSLVTLLNVDPVKVKEQVRIKDPVRAKIEKTVVKLAYEVKDEPKEENENVDSYNSDHETKDNWSRMAHVKTRYSSDEDDDDDDDDEDDVWDDDYGGYDSDFVEKKKKKKK